MCAFAMIEVARANDSCMISLFVYYSIDAELFEVNYHHSHQNIEGLIENIIWLHTQETI